MAHIRQGYIIPLQKGQTGIIVLEIEGISHSPWQLIDEAEHTLVPAGTVLVHQAVLKFNPQVVIILLFDLKLPLLSVGLSDSDLQIFLVNEIVVVKNILYTLTVYRYQHVARRQLKLFCNASRFYPADDVFFVFFHGLAVSSSHSLLNL